MWFQGHKSNSRDRTSKYLAPIILMLHQLIKNYEISSPRPRYCDTNIILDENTARLPIDSVPGWLCREFSSNYHVFSW